MLNFVSFTFLLSYCRMSVCLSVCNAAYCGAQGQCSGWKL